MFSSKLKLDWINNEIYDSRIGNIPPSGSWPQPGWFGKNARIAFIGQNPGLPQDDEPFEHERHQDTYLKFVVQSSTGRVIDTALTKAGLTWDDVVYTNVVKSPTPGNRSPYDFEIAYYKKYLMAQLENVMIDTFIIFGRSAVSALLGDVPIPVELKGVKVDWNQLSISALAVYHPSYVLRVGKIDAYIGSIVQFIYDSRSIQNIK